MTLTARILFGLSLGAVSALQPGPFLAFLLAHSAVAGWRASWPACFAPLFSDLGIAALTLWLMGRLPPAAPPILRGGGGLFLLWLAFRGLRNRQTSSSPPPPSPKQTLLDAITLNLLNPHPWLTWLLLLGPTVHEAWAIHPVHAASFLFSFYGTMIGILFLLIRLFGALESLPFRFRRFVSLFSPLLLVLVGIALLADALWQGFRSFLT